MIKPDETEKFETATLIKKLENAILDYGDIHLSQYIRKIKGEYIHKCPKCHGFGYVIEEYDAYPPNLPDSGWAQDIQHRKVMCDLCHGRGYTEKKYKENRKVIIDGYIEDV